MRLEPLLLWILMGMTACAPLDNREILPDGDRERGATLFSQSVNGAPACSECHTVNGATLVGPSFQDYGETAAARHGEIEALAYTYLSIVNPGDTVVDGFTNSMYSQYEQRLTSQQIADLVAYLLAQ